MVKSSVRTLQLRARIWAVSVTFTTLMAACAPETPAATDPRSIPAFAGAAAGNGCVGGVCAPAAPSVACTPGLLACAASCVNPMTDAANCGLCGRSCGTGACIGGQCVCAAGSTPCGPTCVNTTADPLNCGACGRACGPDQLCQQSQCLAKAAACNPACAGGSTCTAGKCTCPAGQSLCAAACVDVQTFPQHCGACDNPCGAGQLCQAGKCVCAPGQMLCGKDCVDVQTSSTSCGACGKACAAGEVCMAGTCRTGTGMDGCDFGPAHDVNLRDIAVYQSLKIPVMQKGVAVAKAQRVAIIEGRPTLFRVFVDPMAGLAPREFSARLTLKTSAGVDVFFAKQRITKASTDADTASTFQIFVPPEKIVADTSYSLELVECTQAMGATGMSRFPAMGEQPLEPRKTGVLKVVVIPVKANNSMPDTSETALGVYRAYLEAMYPIEKATIRVGTAVNTNYPVNWSSLLEQIRTQRTAEKAATDEYVFGLLKPTATLREYCRGGCTAGIGYVGPAQQAATRAAVGLAFADEMSGATMAHEIGHNHGRNHAPCAPGGQISGVDGMFPYMGAKIGTWGYDSRKKVFFNPDSTTDIMGYCDPKWISDYTYKGLIERVATLNAAKLELFDPDLMARYQVMIVEDGSPRWSQPFSEPAEPFGTPESADALDIDGHVVEHITVYRTQMTEGDASTVVVPEAKRGWNSIKLHDTLPLAFSAPITVPAPNSPN